IWKIVVLRI
ncbi:putative exported protease domain protein, partial [Chlamydia psittaci 08-2626_L3]